MAEAYFTFKGATEGITDAFYPTQALADAGATDSDITAKQGVQTIPDNYRPNKAYWDGTKLLEEIPEIVVFASLPEVDQMKTATRSLHDGLVSLEGVLDTIRHWYPTHDAMVAHDMLTFAHRAIRGVMLSTHWTNTQKLQWLAAMALGPTDVPASSPIQFFEVVEEARGTDDAIPAPTDYFLWAKPDDAVRVALASAAGETSTAAANFVAAATDFTVFVNGAWINDITA